MSDEFFAPPPFQPEAALQRLKRELRELGLAEREGRFERRGQAIARAALAEGVLRVALVKRPGRSPEWRERLLADAAAQRDFVAEVKKQLASWSDRDD